MRRPARVDAVVHCDVVVVGSGAAGLAVALAATPRRVTLVTGGRLAAHGSTPLAQGGIAAALGPDDSPSLHAEDTVRAAAGLADPEAVRILTEAAPAAIHRVLADGARFDPSPRGGLALGREAAHSRARIVHAGGDATGAELARGLGAAVRRGAARVLESTQAEELTTEDGRVTGVLVRRADGRRWLLRAAALVLATGGIGRLWSRTTNPRESYGAGLAMAARAGALLADLEFVQFHPTALAVGADPMPLVTEALRGASAAIVDDRGRRFLLDEHEDGELAPRDVVARALARRLLAGGACLLDARRAVGEAFPERFPTVFRLAREHGLDPRVDLLPVSPAAHYHMGGVATDSRGLTSQPGLWACGEVASTGVHGANRLASNSLLEALVFGWRVGEALGRRTGALEGVWDPTAAATTGSPEGPPTESPPTEERVERRIREILWRHVGVEREAGGLETALEELARLRRAPLDRRLRDLVTVGGMVTSAALARRESRGAHFRTDHPAADPASRRSLFSWSETRAELVAEPERAAGRPAEVAR